MIHLVEQILGLVGKLIGDLLDWPFLLMVFLVWLVSRFRDQIGSMLDRRSAVGSGELSKKIHHEVDPMSQKLEALTSRVSDLQSQMRKVEDVQSIERQNRMLTPITAKVETLERLVPQIQASMNALSGKEIVQHVQRGLDPVNREIKLLKDSLGELQAKLQDAAPAAGLVDLTSRADRLVNDLGSMKNSMDRVDALAGNLASKEEVERLKSGVEPLDGQITELKAAVESLSGRLDGMAGEVEEIEIPDVKTIEQEFKNLKEAIRQLQSLHPSGNADQKPKKRGKAATARPAARGKI